jgi:cytochrome P450
MPEMIPSGYLISPEFAADPYGLNARLRDIGPVHPIDFPPGAQAFLVVGYEHVRAAFVDPRLSKDLRNGPDWFRRRMTENSPVLAYNMVTADPPDHSRLRRLVARELSPRRIQQLAPRVQEITDELVDALPAAGEFDLIERFCLSLPLIVICELLGVPVADRPAFRQWTAELLQSAYVQGEAAQRRRAASEAIGAYFAALIHARRAHRRDDLISGLVAVHDLEGGYNHDELISTLVFLLIAGHETTVHMISNGMAALLLNPWQLKQLSRNPGLVPQAVEEFLRYDGPVERGTLRFATENMEIAGTLIPRGSFVHLSIGSAHRDPEAFEDPDRLDVHRDAHGDGGRHMAFGHGAHFCLGAPLARLEGQIAFETLLRRVPGLELAVAPEKLRWVADSSIVHGLESLPVRRRPA